MIQDISELQDFTRQLGEKVPLLKDEIVLNSPGCSDEEIERLKALLPDLPASYIRCIRQVALKGVSIGYFRLWPREFGGSDFAAKMIATNTSDRNPLLPFLRQKSLYEVAAWEAEPICVPRSETQQRDGGVFKVSFSNPILEAKLLAANFEESLLIAGNLDAVRGRYAENGGGRDAIQEFLTLLEFFHLPNDAVALWKTIGEGVLLE